MLVFYFKYKFEGNFSICSSLLDCITDYSMRLSVLYEWEKELAVHEIQVLTNSCGNSVFRHYFPLRTQLLRYI